MEILTSHFVKDIKIKYTAAKAARIAFPPRNKLTGLPSSPIFSVWRAIEENSRLSQGYRWVKLE